MQKTTNGKALANAAGNSLKHSILAKNNQLRKVAPEQHRKQKEMRASVWKRSWADNSAKNTGAGSTKPVTSMH